MIHITFVREELAHWLEKGGEIRGKLNGIGFAQQLNMDVDTSQHLVVRDVSLQGSRLSCPVANHGKICRQKSGNSWRRWTTNGISNITASANSKMSVYSRRVAGAH